MRLVACNVCKTVEEVPDLGYDLEQGDVDPLLEEIFLRHTQRDPMRHGGADLKYSPWTVGYIEDEKWVTDRDQVLKSFQEANRKVGFDPWVYEAINTYGEDALRCYNEHRRPKDGCIDWWSDSKRLGRPTETGRKVVKDRYKLGERDPHLCMYCPVATHVQTEINFKRGLYKAG